MAGHIYVANYYNDKTEGSEYYEVFNCAEYKSVILENPTELKTFDHSKADWFKNKKGTPGGDLLDYYCSKNKKYTMLDFFGQDNDISNYIISEMYSLVDTSQYIFEIKNNNPYIPTLKDEKLIRDAITKWLTENYPNQTFNLPKDIYSKSKYSTSRMGFGIPDDIYVAEIIPNSEIGKIIIEFDFTRISIPEQYRKNDEVRILNNNEDEE